MRILALCGSLRRESKNRRALQTARALAPSGVEIRILDGLGHLPLFSPDLDQPAIAQPDKVIDFQAEIESATGLLIACPEYAHGVPGAFKNALDWLVGSVVFPGKPVALLNIAPHAVHAQAALREILTTMSADIVDVACCTVPFPSPERPDMEEAFATAIQSSVSAFIRELMPNRGEAHNRRGAVG